jgi:hypothetical protein
VNQALRLRVIQTLSDMNDGLTRKMMRHGLSCKEISKRRAIVIEMNKITPEERRLYWLDQWGLSPDLRAG